MHKRNKLIQFYSTLFSKIYIDLQIFGFRCCNGCTLGH